MNNNRKITLGANKNIILEFTDERIIPASGLAVVGALLEKSDFAKNLTAWISLKTAPGPDQK